MPHRIFQIKDRSPLFWLGAVVSVSNATYLAALKRLHILNKGELRFREVIGPPTGHSPENGQATVVLHLDLCGDLKGFFDPTNEALFLRSTVSPTSRVTVSGIGRQMPATGGHVRIFPWRNVEYVVDFRDDSGVPYRVRGVKSLWQLDVLRAWSLVTGEVTKRPEGERIASFVARSGETESAAALIPFLKSLRLL
ncbi:hypothetical protein K8I61_04730 [bacterium]|nr:hypothetical protein [bacterium]